MMNPSSSRWKIRSRIRRGAGAQVFAQIVQISIRFAEVPLFIGFWGIHMYGEWLMITAIPAYFALGDMGFVAAAGREMSMRSSAGDQEGAVSVFQSVWTLLLFISLIVASVSLFFRDTTMVADWLGIVSIRPKEIRIIFLIFIGHALISFQSNLLNGGFWCTGRYPLGIFWIAITQLFEFMGLAVALIAKGGPVMAATLYLIGRLLGTVLTRISLYRVTSWLRFGFSRVSTDELKRLLVPSLASLAFPVGNALNIQGMRLVVGIAMGPSMVAAFTPMRTLSRFAMQPVVTINRVIEPELSMAYGQRDMSRFASLFTRSCQIAFWTGMIAFLCLASVGNWLLPLWTNGKVAIHWPFYFLILLAAVVNANWYTALMAPYATNRHGRIAVIYGIVYGLVAILGGYAGAICIGLTGVGLTLAIVEVIMAVCVVPMALQFSGQSWRKWVMAIIQPPYFLFCQK